MRTSLVGAIGVAVMLAAAPASAAAAACGALSVSGELSPKWQAAVERLGHDLDTVGGPECPSVRVIVEDGRVALRVILADGRTASRFVDAPDELGSVAFGLLASIPPDLEPSSPPPEEPRPLLEVPPLRAVVAEPFISPAVVSPEPAPVPSASKVVPAFGLAFGTKFAVPFGVVASQVELGTDIRVRDWVVSAHAVGSPLGARLSDDAVQYREWGASGGLGRWFALGKGGIAWTAGSGLESSSIEHAKTRRQRDDFTIETTTRWVTPFGSRWHPALAAQLDALPSLALADGERTRAGHEGFPAWSASLRFGIFGDPL